MSVTMRDVATAAGVSPSTASRALSGRGYVADDARRRVVSAAARLGFIPNAHAQTLRHRRSDVLGLLVSHLADPFYAELATGAYRAARAAGYSLILIDGDDESSIEGAVQSMLALRVAGVILTPTSAAEPRAFLRAGIPIVEVDRQFAADDCDAVVVDNYGAAEAITRRLVESGHRRIAIVLDEDDWTTGKDRLAGYRAALQAGGLPLDDDLVLRVDFGVAGGREALQRIIAAERPITAAFAANGVLAEGLWREAADRQVRVPEDISLVAFDDAPWMSMVRPGVTAARQPTRELGAAAVDAVLQRTMSPAHPRRVVRLGVVVTDRGSVARAVTSPSQ